MSNGPEKDPAELPGGKNYCNGPPGEKVERPVGKKEGEKKLATSGQSKLRQKTFGEVKREKRERPQKK